jgi:hypothetical protein
MSMRRRVFVLGSVLAIIVVTSAVALAGHGTTNVLSFTGCLKTSNGSLSRIAVGDTPQSSCPGGNVEMHVSGGDITSVATPSGSGIQGGGTNGALSLSLATVPAARAYSSVNVTVADSSVNPALHIVPFNSESFDTDNLHDLTTNNGRLTATRAGIYVISANVEWCNNSLGFRTTSILLGENGVMGQSRIDAATDGFHTSQSVTAILDLPADAYVQLGLQQGSGGDLCTLVTSDGNPTLAMTWVGPG